MLAFASFAASVTEKRMLPSFNAFTNESRLDINYIQSNEYKVVVNMEERFVQNLKTEVQSGMLRIYMEDDVLFGKGEKYVILVYAPVLVEVHNVGMGNVQLGDLTGTFLLVDNTGGGELDFACGRNNTLDAYTTVQIHNRGNGIVTAECNVNEMSIENEGSGNVEVRGYTLELKVSNIGAGTVDAQELTAQRANLSIVGMGRVVATVTGIANLTRRGLGTIEVFGEALIIQK